MTDRIFDLTVVSTDIDVPEARGDFFLIRRPFSDYSAQIVTTINGDWQVQVWNDVECCEVGETVWAENVWLAFDAAHKALTDLGMDFD